MTDKEKLMLIDRISQLQVRIAERFNMLISEQVIRRGLSEEELQRFISGIEHVLAEERSFIVKNLPIKSR